MKRKGACGAGAIPGQSEPSPGRSSMEILQADKRGYRAVELYKKARTYGGVLSSWPNFELNSTLLSICGGRSGSSSHIICTAFHFRYFTLAYSSALLASKQYERMIGCMGTDVFQSNQ